MNSRQLPENILKTLPNLFSYRQEDGQLRITTPYLDPDGDYVDLYLVDTPAGLYFTDLGETIGYLLDHGIRLRSSLKRRKIVDDIVLTQGIEFCQGEFRVPVKDRERAAWLLMRLSQAVIQIHNLVFDLRPRIRSSFKDQVEEYWRTAHIPYESNYTVEGRSGETYRVDFYLPLRRRPWLVKLLSSRSKSAANTLVSHVIRLWHDLHQTDMRYGYLSILDDSVHVWKAAWLEQLGALSEIVVWSERKSLLALLKQSPEEDDE